MRSDLGTITGNMFFASYLGMIYEAIALSRWVGSVGVDRLHPKCDRSSVRRRDGGVDRFDWTRF